MTAPVKSTAAMVAYRLLTMQAIPALREALIVVARERLAAVRQAVATARAWLDARGA